MKPPSPRRRPGPRPDPIETDPRFPSGPWTGFFQQKGVPGAPDKSWMDLRLTFQNGSITGTGRDRVGEFTLNGKYDLDDGRCYFHKRYKGMHDVYYKGFNEGRGIWGTWEIPPVYTGGFHIWPEAMGDPRLDRLKESRDLPAEAEAPARSKSKSRPRKALAGC
ncbi:hypothetical protein EP7_002338 [Isosphaeraceae bacterium EP7]